MSDKSSFDKDFFSDEAVVSKSRTNEVMGNAGMWMLHAVKLFLVAYSGYHGIHAAMIYAGDSAGAAIFQILGFLVIESTILGLYIAWINKMLLGTAQRIAAFAVWLICFALAMMAVVVDSQIALLGLEALPRSAELYLNWVMPLAPFIAGAGGALVHSLDPQNLAEQEQEKSQAAHTRNLSQAQFVASIRSQEAELEVQKVVKNMQLGSRLYVANALHEMVKSPETIRQLQQQALRDLPMLLNSAGIDTGQYRVGSSNPIVPPVTESNIIEMPETASQPIVSDDDSEVSSPHPFRLDAESPVEGEPTDWEAVARTFAEKLGITIGKSADDDATDDASE